MEEALRHLKERLSQGQHWYRALLEAMALWPLSEEEVEGRRYTYLIANEAFDWLALGERLCQAVDGLLPGDEKLALLFQGKPPLELAAHEFRRLIGSAKYRAYLNYFYGIAVEEALLLAVQEEVRKEAYSRGFWDEEGVVEEAYRRLYGSSREQLLASFFREKGLAGHSLSLAQGKEFTYWLFRRRLLSSDPALVASDTKKGLLFLQSLRQAKGVPSWEGGLPEDLLPGP